MARPAVDAGIWHGRAARGKHAPVHGRLTPPQQIDVHDPAMALARCGANPRDVVGDLGERAGDQDLVGICQRSDESGVY
jgi:hypothetical protein